MKQLRLHWGPVMDSQDGTSYVTVMLEKSGVVRGSWYPVLDDPRRPETGHYRTITYCEDPQPWEAAEDEVLREVGLTREQVDIEVDEA